MKLFKRKKSTIEPANKKDAQLPEIAIIIDGQTIKPMHGDNILKLVAWEMEVHPAPKNAKPTNFHITNFYVYHSLKEGAAAQNLSFPYSPTELFFFLDLEDVGRLIHSANQFYGFNEESFKSPKFKKYLN